MTPHLMLVEDDAVTRYRLRQLLVLEGFDVAAFATAEEAYEHARETDVDVALLDVRLPGMWGDELAQRLKHLRPPTRIVFVTGELGAAKRLPTEVQGCEVFTKPVSPQDLLAGLRVRGTQPGGGNSRD